MLKRKVMSPRMRASVNSSVKSIKELLILELIEVLEKRYKKRNRKTWVRDFRGRWDKPGSSDDLINRFLTEDEKSYRNRLRIGVPKFQELLSRISKSIQRLDTNMRDALHAKTKLEVTLHYLATGDSLVSLEHLYRVPRSTISVFIPEVCEAISDALKEFMMVPTSEEWKKIELGFRNKWNFPGCIGAIDGKHIAVRNRVQCDTDFVSYKGMNRILLLALVDDNYCFTYIDVSCNEKVTHGSVLTRSTLGQMLEQNTWNAPKKSVVIGSEAFPLKTYLMTPYSPRAEVDNRKKIFNYRLLRARRVVENAFGILVDRFRIFEKPIALSIWKVDKIAMAVCTLHNWLMKTQEDYITENYISVEDTDRGVIIPGQWRYEEPLHGLQNADNLRGSNYYSVNAKVTRECYADYFVEGTVPWQENMIQ